jgi:hypothetical protein
MRTVSSSIEALATGGLGVDVATPDERRSA